MRKPKSPVIDLDRSTCQLIARHARQRPTAIAVVNQDFRVTYHSLALHVLRVMDALTAAGLRAGQILGVETNDRGLHLLILLAAEALGVTTLSLVPMELEPPANLDRLCDRILVSRPVPAADPTKILLMTPNWIAYVLTLPTQDEALRVTDQRLEALERQPAPDALVRLIKSSGTTGVPKVMRMTHLVQQLTLRKNVYLAAPEILRQPDYLCLYNFSVRGSHARALLILQLGGTIRLTTMNLISEMVAAGTGNYALFLAGDLVRFIRAMPYRGDKFDLHIDVIGSAVPATLRQELREKIAHPVAVTYGTNEVHYVSVVDDDNLGTLFPDVQVKIVDGSGNPVPSGERGLIRIKSDTDTDGYVGAPELTRAAFIDGWYHTNDVGFQPAEGKLVVLGRNDDMLNIGGVKIAPGPIEARLRAIDGVRDVLVTSIDDHQGSSVMLVAVETGPGGGPAKLGELIAPIVTEYVSYSRLIKLPLFPRTESGKIRREDVKRLYRQAARTAIHPANNWPMSCVSSA